MEERQQNMRFDANLMKRLSDRFRRRTSPSPAIPRKDTELTEVVEEEEDHHGIGAIIRNDARSNVLRQKLDFEPLFKLRGVDVFKTDCAEPEMGTHPFLMKYVVTFQLFNTLEGVVTPVYEKLTSLSLCFSVVGPGMV
jgi:hypothetical protein